jgi:hypothetical protein
MRSTSLFLTFKEINTLIMFSKSVYCIFIPSKFATRTEYTSYAETTNADISQNTSLSNANVCQWLPLAIYLRMLIISSCDNAKKGARKYSINVYNDSCTSFCALPLAAVLDDRFLCVHGGISPELIRVDDINSVSLPLIRINTRLLHLLHHPPHRSTDSKSPPHTASSATSSGQTRTPISDTRTRVRRRVQ